MTRMVIKGGGDRSARVGAGGWERYVGRSASGYRDGGTGTHPCLCAARVARS